MIAINSIRLQQRRYGKRSRNSNNEFFESPRKTAGIHSAEAKKITELQKDLHVLQEAVNGTWDKEIRLSELKTELAAAEPKIMLSIAPEAKEEPLEQVEKQKEVPNISEAIVKTKGIHMPRSVL